MTTPTSEDPLYSSRAGAGALLGSKIRARLTPPIVIWGMAPTGVEIAAAAATVINCSFDVVVAVNVGIDGVGVVGAMAEDMDAVLDPDFAPGFGAMEAMNDAMESARREISRERILFRGQRQLRTAANSTLVIVDGHVTSAWKLLAAAAVAQTQEPEHLLLAAAVSTRPVADRIAARHLEFACPTVVPDPKGHPQPFGDPGDPSAERLRSIVVAREAA